MSEKLPNMLDNTIAKIRDMVDVNSVVGQPMDIGNGVTIIPISKVTVGFAGGGCDYVSKHPNQHENPFGGGVGAGMNIVPIAFLVIKEGSVRMLPVALPANTTVDRLVEMVPETIDKISGYVDAYLEKKENK